MSDKSWLLISLYWPRHLSVTLTVAGCLMFCSFLISVFTAFEVMSVENHIWFTAASTDTMKYKSLIPWCTQSMSFPQRTPDGVNSVEAVLRRLMILRGGAERSISYGFKSWLNWRGLHDLRCRDKQASPCSRKGYDAFQHPHVSVELINTLCAEVG